MLRIWLFIVILCFSCSAAFGAGIPVIDTTNIVQSTVSANENVAQTLKQIEEYKKQVEQYTKQLEQLKEQLRNGMGFGDLTGQFDDILSGLDGINDLASFDSNSIMNQFQSGGGGGGAASNPEAVVSSLNTVEDVEEGGVPPPEYGATVGPGGTDNRAFVEQFGDPAAYEKIPQNKIRWYVKGGAEAQIAATETWLNALGDHQKHIDDNMKNDIEKFKSDLETAGDDEGGGTNKLITQLGIMITKMIQLQYAQQLLMIKRDTADATAQLLVIARTMDQDMQGIRANYSDHTYQDQKTGSTPMQW